MRTAQAIVYFLALLPVAHAQQNIAVISQSTGDTLAYLACTEIESRSYVAAVKLAAILNCPFSVDHNLKHFTFQCPQCFIRIFAHSPYVTANSKIFQMPVPTYYRHEEFYIPLSYFLACVADFLPQAVTFDEEEMRLIMRQNPANIIGLAIDEKENGILLRILTSHKFPLESVYTSASNGWFYVDIFGGSVDTLQPFPVTGLGAMIKNVIPIQLSGQSARLSFQLQPVVIEKNIMSGDSPPEILVSLRTSENIADELLTELEREKEKWKIDTIILDPGHGGQDPGAIGRNGTFEKKVTLEIAKEIKQEIERRMNVRVLMTRTRDTFLALKSRTGYANHNGGKLFISIHADSNPHRGLSGHTVYFMGPAKTEEARQAAQSENSAIRFEDTQNPYQDLSDAAFILAANAQNSYNKESQAFAGIMDSELMREGRKGGYGVRQAGFYVLYGASMPNLLLETGFISNRIEEEELKTKDCQKEIARAVCNSILKFKSQFENL